MCSSDLAIDLEFRLDALGHREKISLDSKRVGPKTQPAEAPVVNATGRPAEAAVLYSGGEECQSAAPKKPRKAQPPPPDSRIRMSDTLNPRGRLRATGCLLAAALAILPTAVIAQGPRSLSERADAAQQAGRLDEAFRLRREAAESGDPRAQWSVARMFAFGAGVPKNAQQAQFWKRKAAEQGEAAAQASIGIDFLEEKPEPRANAEAAYWCRQAAEQGNPDGQACMGRLYAEGQIGRAHV